MASLVLEDFLVAIKAAGSVGDLSPFSDNDKVWGRSVGKPSCGLAQALSACLSGGRKVVLVYAKLITSWKKLTQFETIFIT